MRYLLSFSMLLLLRPAQAQTYTEVLGRPTDSSMTMSILFDRKVSVYWEYGTAQGNYTARTGTFTADAGIPLEADIRNLQPGTRYHYRTCYRPEGSTDAFTLAPAHSFQTRRPAGSTFSFVVEADPHLDSNTIPDSYRLTLKHMLTKDPDFIIDLGDNFMNDKLPVINQAEIVNRNILFRNYFNEITHTVPLFLTMGNHEGELGWLVNKDSSSLPSMAALVRKKYYPNPFPNGFYSGNATPDPIVGLRENYYAWEWGDALFVVIDPYMYTKSKPEWGWTLGQAQYDWFRSVLANSKARFKFIFSHQLVGGTGTEGRGGSEVAHLYEMGGRNTDSTWAFEKNRPGWEKPIHDLMVQHKASIYFHGHDHFYGRQEKDGVIYQEVPQPSARNINTVTGLAYGYSSGTLLPSRGYILVTVSESKAQVDYVRTYLPAEENANRKNGDIAFSYTVNYSPVTGVYDIDYVDLIRVFPNPATDRIRIEFTRPVARYRVRLLDAGGRPVLETVKRELDVHALPSGIYYLLVEGGGFICSRQIVIGH